MRANVYFFRLLALQSVLFVWLQLEQREKKAAQKAARVGQQKALLADEEEARRQIEFEKAEQKRKQVEAALAS